MNHAYENWTIEQGALDAALTNVARQALQAVNRGGVTEAVLIEGTEPPQYVVIGTLEQIAELVCKRREDVRPAPSA